MLREWANKDQLDEIDEALRPPLSWRDPSTGMPAGWGQSDEEIWAEWEAAGG